MNTVALSFILSIDELICASAFTGTAKYMLDSLEPLPLFEPASVDGDMDTWERHQENRQWNICTPKIYFVTFPKRLFGILAVTIFFQYKYYVEHCQQRGDGSWISLDLHVPLEER